MLKMDPPRADLYFKNDVNDNGKRATLHDPSPFSDDYARIGPNSLNHRVEFTKDSLSNWKRGVCKRVAPGYSYEPQLLTDFSDFVSKFLDEHINPLEHGLDGLALREVWLTNSKYTKNRRDLMRRLYDDYYSNKIDPKRIYINKSFIKREFYDDIKEPRIINSRSDTFKAIMGGWIHAVESLIMKEHYIKHKTPEVVARIMDNMNNAHQYVYETDYSSFEGSFHPAIQDACEVKLWKHVFRNYPHVLDILLKSYTTNVIVYKRKTKAVFKGSRMSGDLWTSLANGFTNQMLIEFMIHETQRQKGFFHIDYLVEGDDGFICTDMPLNFDIPNRLGFKLKCEQKTDKNDVSFCGICEFQGKLIPDIRRILNKYGYIHGRNLVNALSSNSKRSQKRIRDMIHSKALSLLAQSKGIPILQSIAQQQLRLGGHFNPKYVDWWENEFYDFSHVDALHAEPISDEVRRFVAKRFNIPIDVQLDIEQFLENYSENCYDIDIDSTGTRPARKCPMLPM